VRRPATVGDEARQQPDRERKERRRDGATHSGDDRCADHDGDEAGRGDRRQHGPNAQELRQNQTDCSEHLRDTDESQERPWQRNGSRERLERQHELDAAGEQEEKSQQSLNNPQHFRHLRISFMRWSNGTRTDRRPGKRVSCCATPAP